MARKAAFAIYLLLCVVLMAFTLSLPTSAVRLTSDAEEERPVRPPVPPVPPPTPPRPPRPNPLIRLIDRVRIEGPYAEGGLVVFTLTTRRPENHVNYLTLDEGISSGQIVVQETRGGSVPTLQVRNLSNRWAFLMSGELVAGGKQNRTVRQDALLPPGGSTWVPLPVYCVEQHRWSAPGRFDSSKAAAPNALRSGLNQGYDQGAVWREVERAQKGAGVESRTGDVTVLYTDKKTRARIDEAAGRLIRCIPRRQYVGLVIARGHTIVSADLFANSRLYSKLYEKVIRSHVVEVLNRTYVGHPGEAQVRAFLNRIHGASMRARPAPGGVGRMLSIYGNGIGGSALDYNNQCIHAALFPRIVRPVPMPGPVPHRPRRR